jgi:hypothetical protein
MVDESLNVLSSKGRCPPLFVSGEWGTGKSHMLKFIRGVAAHRGVAHVRVDLNARGEPLNYPQRFYPWLAGSLCLDSARGVRSIVEAAFADPLRRDALLRFSWANESGRLGVALRSIILTSRESGSDMLVDHSEWDVVLGADLASFDYKRTKALERMAALAKLLRTVGGAGLVVVLDEAETIDQLWNRLSRLGAYETLGAFCGMEATWAVFGVTERFQRCVNRDLTNGILSYASTSHAAGFLRAWCDGTFRQIRPPQLSDDHAQELAIRVVQAYEAAYAIRADALDVSAVLNTWKANPGRNPRRLIRGIIDALDVRRDLTASTAQPT